MNVKANNLLLGAVLLTLSAYSVAADTVSQDPASHSDRSITVTGTHSTDAQIRAEVTRRINEKPELRSENIVVQSSDHDVYLSGLVETRMDSDEAGSIAQTVPGVRNVYNGLASNNS
jgi:osmotically-inducible protein OsmY